MLMKHTNISTQSNWVRAHVKFVNPMAKILNTSILLRPEFIESNKWEMDSCEVYQIFTSTSYILIIYISRRNVLLKIDIQKLGW